MTSTIIAIALLYAFAAGITFCLLMDEYRPTARAGAPGYDQKSWLRLLGWTAIWPALWIRDWWREWRLPQQDES